MKLSLFQASLLLLSVVSADKAPLQKVLQSSNPPIEKTVAIIGKIEKKNKKKTA
jgi:hypothetical protein